MRIYVRDAIPSLIEKTKTEKEGTVSPTLFFGQLAEAMSQSYDELLMMSSEQSPKTRVKVLANAT